VFVFGGRRFRGARDMMGLEACPAAPENKPPAWKSFNPRGWP